MNRLIVTVMLGLILSGSTFATNQRMVCEPVVDVCGPDGQIQSNIMGPKGSKGDRGDHGRRGNVDYVSINNTLEELVAAATATLRAKVEKLENIISTKFPIPVDCTDGFVHGDKCYFFKVQRVTSRSNAAEVCEVDGGILADIVSLEHQTQAMIHIREKVGLSFIIAWIGSQYEYATNRLRLSDGTTVYAPSLRWRPGYQSVTSTGMKLMTDSNVSANDQGVFNSIDARSAEAVLCEK